MIYNFQFTYFSVMEYVNKIQIRDGVDVGYHSSH